MSCLLQDVETANNAFGTSPRYCRSSGSPSTLRMDPTLGECWEVPLGDTSTRVQQKFPYWELEGIMGRRLKGFIRWSFFWLTNIDPVAESPL